MALLNFPREFTNRTIQDMAPTDVPKLAIDLSRYIANASASRLDLGRVIRMDSASPLTVTLNHSAVNFGATRFYVGEALVFTQWGAGAVTFAAGGTASLVSKGALVAIEAQYALAWAMYTEGDVWWLGGQLA